MAVVPQINYRPGSVRPLALHDVGGPGRVARAETAAARAVGNAAIGVANARARQFEAEFGVKELQVGIQFAQRESKLRAEFQLLDDLDNLAGKLFKAATLVDQEVQRDQIKQAELAYADTLGQSLTRVNADTHRAEPIDPSNPAAGSRTVSNADVLVDRTITALDEAEGAALKFVSNPRARERLETTFAENRVQTINRARSEAVKWQTQENRANAALRIEQALAQGDVAKAQRFTEQAAGVLTPTEIYKAQGKINNLKVGQGYKAEIDKAFNAYDPATSMKMLEELQQELADPMIALDSASVAGLKRLANEKVQSYWYGRMNNVLTAPPQTTSYGRQMDELDSIAMEMASVPIGRDGFATVSAKERAINQIQSVRTDLKVRRGEMEAAQKSIVTEHNKAIKEVNQERTSAYIGLVVTELKDPNNLLSVRKEIENLSQQDPEDVFGHPHADHTDVKSLVSTLNTVVEQQMKYETEKDKMLENAVADQDDTVHQFFRDQVHHARRLSEDDIQYLERVEDVRAYIIGKEWNELGLSDPDAYDEMLKSMDTTVRQAQAMATEELKVRRRTELAVGYLKGHSNFNPIVATAEEKAAYEQGYLDYALIGQEQEWSEAQVVGAQLAYMTEHAAPTQAFVGEVVEGLASDSPNQFLRMASQMLSLKDSQSFKGATVYNETYDRLDDHQKAVLEFGIGRLRSGLDLTEEAWLQYRNDLYHGNPAQIAARKDHFDRNERRIQDNEPAGYGRLRMLMDEEGLNYEALPTGAKENFMTYYSEHSRTLPIVEGARIPEAARRAYADMRKLWAPTTMGDGGWVEQGMETRVGASQITPPWLTQEVNRNAREAGINLEGTVPMSVPYQERDERGALVEKHGTVFIDRETGQPKLHGSGTQFKDEKGNSQEGKLFMLPDIQYQESKAFEKDQAQKEEDSRAKRIAHGQNTLATVLTMTTEYESKNEMINMFSREAGGLGVRMAGPYIAQMMQFYTEAEEFMYIDPDSRSKPNTYEMFWVEKEIAGRVQMMVDKGIYTPRQASEARVTILSMISQNAKRKKAARERQRQRVEDAKTFDMWLP